MNRIRTLRQSMGWTQAQLGKKIGAAKSTVSEYESEKHLMDPKLICDLCDLFGCTSDYLLGRADAPWPAVTPEQADLLRVYDALPLEIRKAVDGLMAPYREQANKKETA